jgi:valyl-tRNA synthetase
MSTTQELHELPAQYDPGQTERAIYERWVAAGIFSADEKRSSRNGGDREPFVIVMPPPNVTAVLHMGHGLNNTVQDVIVRWRRMVGDEALWVPGTDHAGIATQNIIEKQLAAEGKKKSDLGREAFVARTVAFVEETGGEILRQLRAIGSSCDWNRTAYTLSPELSRAVREAFVQLHERGLIYRGHRVIHWCPRCLTSLSDEEAEHSEESGNLYHIAYPIVGAKDKAFLTVATTRPETMLGDVAVAVHPEDERYKQFIGKSVLLPIADVEIPVIADDYVDPEFGTGVVKITPAHDPNDFEVGRRHKLPMPVIMAPDGTMANGVDADGRVPADLMRENREIAREVSSVEESRVAPARCASLLSVRHRGRAEAVRSVVRQDGAARQACAQRRARRHNSDFARAVGSGLHQLAREHPRLEHLAPAVVGTPHSCLVLRQVQQYDREPHRRHRLRQMRWAGAPGRGRARHLVLVVALSNLDARLAGQELGRPRRILSD